MKLTFTFCDFCNPNHLTRQDNGRGYVELDNPETLKEFGWIKFKGMDICDQCVEEGEYVTS